MEKLIAIYKKAAFDYFFIEKIEAGIVLLGSEVKSVKAGNVTLHDSFCHISGGEIFLKNCRITPYQNAGAFCPDALRSRKLLLHKSEINRLYGKVKEKGLTLVPYRIYFKGNKVKVEICLCRGKKNYDKRQTIKERDIKRDTERSVKEYR